MGDWDAPPDGVALGGGDWVLTGLGVGTGTGTGVLPAGAAPAAAGVVDAEGVWVTRGVEGT